MTHEWERGSDTCVCLRVYDVYAFLMFQAGHVQRQPVSLKDPGGLALA